MRNDSTDRAKVIALPPLILIGSLAAGFLLEFIWPLKISPAMARAYALPLGIALIVAAFAIALSAVHEFSAAKTPVDLRKPSTDLVTSGPYRFSRNPIYLGMIVFAIGTAFVADSLWNLGLTILLAALLQKGVVEPEEAYLERKFGTKYLDYRLRVRRWI